MALHRAHMVASPEATDVLEALELVVVVVSTCIAVACAGSGSFMLSSRSF
jgi:hypothetical protein